MHFILPGGIFAIMIPEEKSGLGITARHSVFTRVCNTEFH